MTSVTLPQPEMITETLSGPGDFYLLFFCMHNSLSMLMENYYSHENAELLLPPASLARARQQLSSVFSSNYCAVQTGGGEGKNKGERQKSPELFPESRKDLHQVVHFAQHCNKQREAECEREDGAVGRGRDGGAAPLPATPKVFFIYSQIKEQNEKTVRRLTFKRRRRYSAALMKNSHLNLRAAQHNCQCFPPNKRRA